MLAATGSLFRNKEGKIIQNKAKGEEAARGGDEMQKQYKRDYFFIEGLRRER